MKIYLLTPYRWSSPFHSYAGLSNEEARQALIRHVSNNYCLNKSFAKRMHILNIENSFIYTVRSGTLVLPNLLIC